MWQIDKFAYILDSQKEKKRLLLHSLTFTFTIISYNFNYFYISKPYLVKLGQEKGTASFLLISKITCY